MPPLWIVGYGPKENKYMHAEYVPFFRLEMIVFMGTSSQKGENGIKHCKNK